MPLLETKGAASAQGFGGAGAGASGLVTYIEDVFSTYLYTGTGATQTITNGIDLSGKGGLVWYKSRSNATDHELVDTVRGGTKYIQSNTASGQGTLSSTEQLSFSSTGFSIGGSNFNGNYSTYTYASWTFRKQPKFYDVVTYTGNGSNRTISHNLGSVPGCIIVKRTDTTADWQVYHRSLANTEYLVLNTTAAKATGTTRWNSTTPTSTVFSLGTDTTVNANGDTYVAYLFAHDAGGFGLSGSENVISCGSFTTGSSGEVSVNLGYEPQWILLKPPNLNDDWLIIDTTRQWTADGFYSQLRPNESAAEGSASGLWGPTATGFARTSGTGANRAHIYIAIRRGPMKVPTDATKVFGLNARSGTGANATVTGGQVDDAVLIKNRGSAVADLMSSRLTGTGYLETSSTAAEVAAGTTILQENPWDVMDGVKVGTTSTITNASSNTFINYLFRRAPGFFDVVCYTGTGSNTTQTHNLGVVPELIIVKRRDTTDAWDTYSAALSNTEYLVVNTTAAKATGATRWNSTTPTSTVFSLGTSTTTNASGGTYVAYLFATCAGVSKVGTYTGTGALQTVDCGFAAGARFVLIKRTDSTGDWYLYDSARGISSGNDPYLLLNSTAAEVTGTDYVDTTSVGFQVTAAAPAGLNANGGTYICLAIA